MKDLRRNEFVDMLEMAELLYEANEKFIKCDIPYLGSVTYYPKANKLQINKSNSWEENGFDYIKNILNKNTIIENYNRVASKKSDEELRDEFAGLAMNAMLSNQELFLQILNNNAGNNISGNEALVKSAYSTADAMMKQRKL